MKKIILSLLFIVAISPAFAQTVKYGISGGLNESSLGLSSTPADDNSRLAGFHAGIFSDIDFGKLSIEPGLFYTTKGQQSKSVFYFVTPGSNGGSAIQYGKTIYSYLELPVNILYNIPVSYGKFFIGGGPYIAYGLSAKLKSKVVFTQTNGSSQVNEQEISQSFGSADGDIKRFDFGLGALGGLTLKNRLSISVGFEHGLTNIVQGSTSSIKNNVLAVSLGYSFL